MTTAGRFAFELRLPSQIFWLLIGLSLLGMAVLGFQLALRGPRIWGLAALLALTWTVVIVDIVDLAAPRIGGFPTSAAAYEWTLQGFHSGRGTAGTAKPALPASRAGLAEIKHARAGIGSRRRRRRIAGPQSSPLNRHIGPSTRNHAHAPTGAPTGAMTSLSDEIARRRTFAIISHPDAGKTTLTEKLLLFGGAIQLAGEVKARGERRRARSDWMAIERERGISVSSAVMTLRARRARLQPARHAGPPGFQRGHLPHADRGRLRGDGASTRRKGIEAQTRKLFEVCRLRDVPIITFINKLDREGRDPFDLLDEIEQTLALDVTPASWPIGMGRDFLGTYDLFARCAAAVRARRPRPGHASRSRCQRPRRPASSPQLSADRRASPSCARRSRWRGPVPAVRPRVLSRGPSDAGLFRQRAEQFRRARIAARGRRTGAAAAPAAGRRADGPHRSRRRSRRSSGFVFKVQANIDPQHRDRIAFVRLVLGPLPARHEAEELAHRQG